MTSVAQGSEKKLHKLKKQLSIGNIRRRLHRSPDSLDQTFDEQEHLLEEVEQMSQSVEPTEPDVPSPKLKIPSSLVTLTELEKKQLEDVLMRIGLKDCGL